MPTAPAAIAALAVALLLAPTHARPRGSLAPALPATPLSPEPGAVRAYGVDGGGAVTPPAPCASEAECVKACDGSADWVRGAGGRPPTATMAAELLACTNAVRTSPSYFAKALTDVCAAGSWLPAAAAPRRRPLAPLPPLAAAAQAAADDMASKNYFGHDASAGKNGSSSPSSAAVDRVRRAVPTAVRVGGLVAAGWTSPLDVVGQLLCSAKHRDVLLYCGFDAAGWGVAFPSGKADWKSYYAVYFVCTGGGGGGNATDRCGCGPAGAPAPGAPSWTAAPGAEAAAGDKPATWRATPAAAAGGPTWTAPGPAAARAPVPVPAPAAAAPPPSSRDADDAGPTAPDFDRANPGEPDPAQLDLRATPTPLRRPATPRAPAAAPAGAVTATPTATPAAAAATVTPVPKPPPAATTPAPTPPPAATTPPAPTPPPAATTPAPTLAASPRAQTPAATTPASTSIPTPAAAAATTPATARALAPAPSPRPPAVCAINMALPSRGGPTAAASAAALVFVAGGGGRALAPADVKAALGGGGGDATVAAVLKHGGGHLVQLSLPSNFTGSVTVTVAITAGLVPSPLPLTFRAGGRPPVVVAAALPAAVW